MPLAPGVRLGPHEVISAIGRGGMGEVYRAHDTDLKRDVAVKVLPDELAADPERLARFRREAQLLAALNHPHIAQIYGLEESSGAIALVLELVEGPTLADRVLQGPMPIDEALPVARQVAEATQPTHATPPGMSQPPTMTASAMTQAGMILGTPAYMSPEQARGTIVDRRADVWAFGCMLYEMLTGTRAFPGADMAETIAGVVRAEPAWSRVPRAIPPAALVFLRRSLEKDPRQRVQAIGDVRLALEGALDTAGAATPDAPDIPRWRRAMP